MATYISAAVIARIIKDPNMDKPLMPRTIWEYRQKNSGVIVYAVFYEEEHDMNTSPYVTLPYLLWDHGELTTYGKEFMKVQGQ